MLWFIGQKLTIFKQYQPTQCHVHVTMPIRPVLLTIPKLFGMNLKFLSCFLKKIYVIGSVKEHIGAGVYCYICLRVG